MSAGRPSEAQRRYLARGLEEPGGKLPLFDRDGRRVDPRTVRACIEQGWAEPWFHNPLKPDWLVCRLTDEGRAAVSAGAAGPPEGAGAGAGAEEPAPRSRVVRLAAFTGNSSKLTDC